MALSERAHGIDHSIGRDDAALTLVEYGDFECPNCRQAAPAVKLLLKRFQDGLRFVYRHFPLEEVHPHALLAAEAAEAAGSQGRFWQMHDLLFANQPRLNSQQLHGYAKRLDLDVDRFAAELEQHLHLQRVREHQQSARSNGVRATPTFFLNGAVCDVSFGIDALERAIEEARRSL